MKIEFNTSAIEPMYQWLKDRQANGRGNQEQLRQILQLPDYLVELARYGSAGLPTCGISLDEAVDFFMNFDTKTFSNPRLAYKQPYFKKFYDNLDGQKETMALFHNITAADMEVIAETLKAGLPGQLADEETTYNIIFIISIGNSMGWPYEHYIDFDLANMNLLADKSSFLHIVAHEIYHTYFNRMIAQSMNSQQLFLINFAFEGLAMHFCNNAATIGKPAKYPQPSYAVSAKDWDLYAGQFDLLWSQFKKDWQSCAELTETQTSQLVADHYEKLDYTDLRTGQTVKIEQYPTYYLGCYFWGSIDTALGRPALFAALNNPEQIAATYNKAAAVLHNEQYTL